MIQAREITALALKARQEVGIKVRQPLKQLTMNNRQLTINKELLDLIKEEINVKNIIFGKELKLDTEITSELKEEGIVREIIRYVQIMRKEAGLIPKDRIIIEYSGTAWLNEILKKNEQFISKEARAQNCELKKEKDKGFDFEQEVKIEKQVLWLGIKKI